MKLQKPGKKKNQNATSNKRHNQPYKRHSDVHEGRCNPREGAINPTGLEKSSRCLTAIAGLTPLGKSNALKEERALIDAQTGRLCCRVHAWLASGTGD